MKQLNLLGFFVIVLMLSCNDKKDDDINPVTDEDNNPVITENFETTDTKVFYPDGNEFFIKGVNVNGYNWVWPRSTVMDADLIVDVWKFNFLRVNNVVVPRPATFPLWEDNNDLDKLIEVFSSREIVVMLNDQRVGGVYSRSEINTYLLPFFRRYASKYKDNPYVWLQIGNEPGGSENDMAAWEGQVREIIKAIRDTGNNNMIVVPGMSWGQDSGPSWNCETVVDSKSFILARGPALMNDFDRIMFDFHIYDQWDQCFSKLDGFFTRLEELGLPTMVGEFGVDNAGQINATRVEYMFKAAETHSFGRVAWHWFGGDQNNLTTSGNGGAWHINNKENPTNLTWKGQMIWNDNHNLPLDE